MIVTKKYISRRNKPVNFVDSDINLFEKEIIKKIPRSEILIKKNVYVEHFNLKKFKYFRFLYKHWRMNDHKTQTKIKFYLQDLTNFLLNKKFIPTKRIENASWVIDVRSSQFFHWVCDVLSRIEMLGSYTNNFPILIPDYFLKIDYIYQTLKLLDINFITYKKDEVLLIKNLYITSHAAPSGNYNEEILNRVNKNFHLFMNETEKVNKKVFISRQNAKKRRILNFFEIEPLLIKFGFKVFDFDKTPFSEQLEICNNAEVIAGLHGAGLSNMLFTKSKIKIIEIRNENDSTNNCFFSMASALGHQYYYFKGRAMNSTYDSNFYVDKQKFEKFLLTYFN